jgi:hypothetical protein
VASPKRKFQLVFSLVVATAALLVTWVVLSDDSPFTDYVARHGDAANMWRLTVLLPFVFSAVISRNPHSPSTALFIVGLFLQWSLVGYLLSIPIAALWALGRTKPHQQAVRGPRG